MNIVITGASGFLGRNLEVRLRESGEHRIAPIVRSSEPAVLSAALETAA